MLPTLEIGVRDRRLLWLLFQCSVERTVVEYFDFFSMVCPEGNCPGIDRLRKIVMSIAANCETNVAFFCEFDHRTVIRYRQTTPSNVPAMKNVSGYPVFCANKVVVDLPR